MRLLLLSANTHQDPYPVYPLGLDYVAEAVSPFHEVRTLDANLLENDEMFRAYLKEFEPHAVGISLRNVDNTSMVATKSFLERSRRLVKTVRHCCDAKIILGGGGFSLFPVELLEELEADYGIMGEGERLKDLLSALEKGDLNPDLPGVVVPGKTPEKLIPWTGEPSCLDPGKNAHTSFYLENGGILNFQTKRGCPFQCIYCTYPLLEGKNMRLFDPGEVGRRARLLEDAGAKFLYITDSVFNAHEEHSLAVAASMKAQGVSIPWGGYFIPRVSVSGYFFRLAECGCTHVEFGTESLSEQMLRTYRKPFETKDVSLAHSQAQQAGLFISHFFLLGGPGETKETIDVTLSRIEDLHQSVFFFFCGIRVHPKTHIHSIALKEGSISPETNLMGPVFYTPKGLTHEEISDLLNTSARGRVNWITPLIAPRIDKITRRMYDMGHTGVLWERLIG